MATRSVHVPRPGGSPLAADLHVPLDPLGLVVFAHGSGSGRHSPRNRFVARSLEARGMATLLADLLTGAEERVDVRTAQLRFDIELLARRVVLLIDWAREQPELQLPLGLFGASTGAAAALVASTIRAGSISAIVSRGGRPDLAGMALSQVLAPTLLLVGSLDHQVLELNRQAGGRMRGVTRLELVSGATHLFEEPGALAHVAGRAGDWFVHYFNEDRGDQTLRHGSQGTLSQP